MASDFGWVRSEDGRDVNLAQRFQQSLSGDPRRTQADQGAAKRAAQQGFPALQTGSPATALAMIGLGQVGEFEINGESLGDAICVLNRKAANGFAGASHQAVVEFEWRG